MTGPSKKEVSQAARDLASSSTSQAQKSEAAETLNYRKEAKAEAKPAPKRSK